MIILLPPIPIVSAGNHYNMPCVGGFNATEIDLLVLRNNSLILQKVHKAFVRRIEQNFDGFHAIFFYHFQFMVKS